jgi:predicted nucleic acid-binding protein
MTASIALLDANVLYAAQLRDLLLQLAFVGLFQPRWSAEIEAEWTGNLLLNRPELATQIPATLAMMRSAMPDALVTNYNTDRIAGLSLPDPGDRHVVAAALAGGADVIVTFNLKHFPTETLTPLGLEVYHPDAFLQTMTDAEPLIVLSAVRAILGRLNRPLVSGANYLKTAEGLGLPQTATFLRQHADLWQKP